MWKKIDAKADVTPEEELRGEVHKSIDPLCFFSAHDKHIASLGQRGRRV
jgi:hypothetical protein